MLSVLHNFAIKRSDGSTAANRFFGQKHPELFRWLHEHKQLPPRDRYLACVIPICSVLQAVLLPLGAWAQVPVGPFRHDVFRHAVAADGVGHTAPYSQNPPMVTSRTSRLSKSLEGDRDLEQLDKEVHCPIKISGVSKLSCTTLRVVIPATRSVAQRRTNLKHMT